MTEEKSMTPAELEELRKERAVEDLKKDLEEEKFELSKNTDGLPFVYNVFSRDVDRKAAPPTPQAFVDPNSDRNSAEYFRNFYLNAERASVYSDNNEATHGKNMERCTHFNLINDNKFGLKCVETFDQVIEFAGQGATRIAILGNTNFGTFASTHGVCGVVIKQWFDYLANPLQKKNKKILYSATADPFLTIVDKMGLQTGDPNATVVQNIQRRKDEFGIHFDVVENYENELSRADDPVHSLWKVFTITAQKFDKKGNPASGHRLLGVAAVDAFQVQNQALEACFGDLDKIDETNENLQNEMKNAVTKVAAFLNSSLAKNQYMYINMSSEQGVHCLGVCRPNNSKQFHCMNANYGHFKGKKAEAAAYFLVANRVMYGPNGYLPLPTWQVIIFNYNKNWAKGKHCVTYMK